MSNPSSVATTLGHATPPASGAPAAPGRRTGSFSTVQGPSGPGAVARPMTQGSMTLTLSITSTQVPSRATKPVETSMPGSANGTSFEVRIGPPFDGFQVTPSVEVRWAISISPGQVEKTLANMWRVPADSMMAPGFTYFAFIPARTGVTAGEPPLGQVNANIGDAGAMVAP